MDATRPRRSRDSARRGWYARWRCLRFARHLGFPPAVPVASGPKTPCPDNVSGGLSPWATLRRCA
jgi:hypothetical protein